MGRPLIDKSGQRFGRLIVIRRPSPVWIAALDLLKDMPYLLIFIRCLRTRNNWHRRRLLPRISAISALFSCLEVFLPRVTLSTSSKNLSSFITLLPGGSEKFFAKRKYFDGFCLRSAQRDQDRYILLPCSGVLYPRVARRGGPSKLERVAGIDPAYQPWQGRTLPLCYTRIRQRL